jgi:hypothetical protein
VQVWLDKQLWALVLNFNISFSISSGCDIAAMGILSLL